jgi:hypothetical protein
MAQGTGQRGDWRAGRVEDWESDGLRDWPIEIETVAGLEKVHGRKTSLARLWSAKTTHPD